MNLFHTADWHLGQLLHGHSRAFEHQQFLTWLLDTLESEQADALLLCGDIFDSANPPAYAWQMLYRFLADCRRRLPNLDLILVGGNHDSPAKLDAPHSLLANFGITVVGQLPRDDTGETDWSRLILPLTDASGETAAWCLALPFLRSADLNLSDPALDNVEDKLIAGVTRLYQQGTERMQAQAKPGQLLLATGHAYLAGTELSELSERRILGGNQHALPVSEFPAALDYLALGHLHKAQRVDKSGRVRYSGSPIPLSLAEEHYPHQVRQLRFADGQLQEDKAIRVPRSVEILRIPAKPAGLDSVLAELAALDLPELPLERQPLLEVRVALEQPEPRLREQVMAALEGRAVRLARIHVTHPGQSVSASEMGASLDNLDPEQVFVSGYTARFGDAPEPALMAAFAELVNEVEEQA
ncbi:exonuclease SbcCD subunit D C-terminal domain-containing protein [Ferrimonas balearica]|uniref:exonuclease SbcCD subunit D C-terminal domain-containing protein n=1 Tax=Ferrimonas balearica TaxID=44012 RepID=UPI001C596FB2|nr:exonuclease SbcCD subunit D C-terminal domain-containing protein [Ferrimonas balearica]MBW3140002.1 exonuclease SbcCD subunit D C-terminal domain-containing protein [Ferrimonas balearica]MBY6106890.1 exonuclease SbcCD subunit D C-terminal domain-containing protein [Ferrimonas balearica]